MNRVAFVRETTSTNDIAMKEATADCASPLLVVAERQTAGRGRGGSQWWSRAGALTFSLLLDSHTTRLPPQQWPLISLTAGLAVCAVVETLTPDSDVRIKWPNDVYIHNRKVSGILTEAATGERPMLVIGIGLNVNNSMANAPAELRATATSLYDVVGRPLSLIDTLIDILVQLQMHLQWIDGHSDELRIRWRQRCLLTGRQVSVTAGARTIEGNCLGISDDGALLVQTDAGLERCYAGVVSRWR